MDEMASAIASTSTEAVTYTRWRSMQEQHIGFAGSENPNDGKQA
jgi:hypothetical protein